MKRFTCVLIALITCINGFAQKKPGRYAAIDKVALTIPAAQAGTTLDIANYINQNFKTDSDKLRAIFIWTASNIAYDAENMFVIKFDEKPEDKISKALATHKGICENYAAVFQDICKKAALKAFVVTGYTKSNGYASYLSHAWCAARLNDSWYIFDPTWGSGYLNNGTFVPKINDAYFKVSPSAMIKTHMPFDPMWEFLNYPVTNAEFYVGKTQANTSKAFFSYNDSIAAFEKMDEMAQLKATARRIEGNGIKNGLIYDRLAHIKSKIDYNIRSDEVKHNNGNVELYNSATVEFNEGINEFNAFINYRNAQFKPAKSDAEIQMMVDQAYEKFVAAKAKLKSINNPDANISSLKITLWKSVDDAMDHADEQKSFLKNYFSKGKMGRKSMFYKYTWMGMPLN